MAAYEATGEAMDKTAVAVTAQEVLSSDGMPPYEQCCPPLCQCSTALSLRCLKVGQKARIVSVRAEGELGRRIRDMGLVPGVEVEVVGRAPLRDPVALRLPGFTLSLRNNEADHIVVDVLDGADQ